MSVITTNSYQSKYQLLVVKVILYFFFGIVPFISIAIAYDHGDRALEQYIVVVSFASLFLVILGSVNLKRIAKYKRPYNLVPHQFKFSCQFPQVEVSIVAQWPGEFDYLPNKEDKPLEPSAVPKRFEVDIQNELTKFFEYYNAMPNRPSTLTTMQIEQALQKPIEALVHSLELPELKYDCTGVTMFRPLRFQEPPPPPKPPDDGVIIGGA